ncbi:MAG: tripartite tricarboxylate transporter TctB family protein [Pseudomonadota bacterium]
MRRAELVTAIILGVLSIYLMWKSGEPPAWNPDVGRFANIGFIEGEGPGSGFWPFWLSAVMLICCVWTGVNWWRRKTPPSRSDEPFLDAYGWKMVVMVGGGLLAFLGAVHIVGFYGAIPLFMIYYMVFLGRHSWLASLSVAIALPVFSFFFFDVAMRIVLPKGYLEPLFIPLYDIFL